MTNLLVLKEKIIGFYKNFEYPVKAVGKLILAFLAFQYVNSELGYLESLAGIVPTVVLSVICAFVPVSVFVLIFAAVILLHLFKLSMILSAIALVVFLLFYFIYLKFAPSQGILIILYPVLARYNLHYMIPMIGAMAFNPFAAVPIAFGVIAVKVLEYIKEAAGRGDPGTDVQEIMASYQYIFDKLFADKEMIAYILIFTLVILLVYGISRLSIDYSWYIAIGVGTLINVIGLSMQASNIQGMSIAMVIAGSVIGGLIAALAQFMGCTLDYAQKEYLQFEDDDYYYYVKAVPKIHVTKEERKVKRFGQKSSTKKNTGKNRKDTVKEPAAEIKRPEEPGKTVEETRLKVPVKNTLIEQDTKVSVRKPKIDPLNDFDELSFDGFDFDDLDRK
ncbi:hypothetical protein [Frisingicoccus sp.]|uniref:hypothetical protein n=1 Tax=Frisingicoccus sp. TaxID=1918627 RepID=UPI0025C28B23|nr:hypothetical protein [Frisingicoccus sp.]